MLEEPRRAKGHAIADIKPKSIKFLIVIVRTFQEGNIFF